MAGDRIKADPSLFDGSEAAETIDRLSRATGLDREATIKLAKMVEALMRTFALNFGFADHLGRYEPAVWMGLLADWVAGRDEAPSMEELLKIFPAAGSFLRNEGSLT